MPSQYKDSMSPCQPVQWPPRYSPVSPVKILQPCNIFFFFFCHLPLEWWLALSLHPILKLIVTSQRTFSDFPTKSDSSSPTEGPISVFMRLFITEVILCCLYDHSISSLRIGPSASLSLWIPVTSI